MMLSFERAPEFDRDLKNLQKKWRSLPADITAAESALAVVYGGNEEIYKQFFANRRAAIVTKKDDVEVVKMRLDCKSLGNDKKTRIVFVASISRGTITFIELYAKNSHEREDASRIKNFLP